MIKLLQRWIFDSYIDINQLKMDIHHATSHNQYQNKKNKEQEQDNNVRVEISPSGELVPTIEDNCECFFCDLRDMLRNGLYHIPDFIRMDSEKYQTVPIKWKFTLLITITIIIVEFCLFQSLYSKVFRHCPITNITDASSIDIRIRNTIFLFFDFCISVPILYYIINPYIVNKLIPYWMYKKEIRDDSNFCKYMTNTVKYGIKYLETIARNEILSQLLHSRPVGVAIHRHTLQVINIESNIDYEFKSAAGCLENSKTKENVV